MLVTLAFTMAIAAIAGGFTYMVLGNEQPGLPRISGACLGGFIVGFAVTIAAAILLGRTSQEQSQIFGPGLVGAVIGPWSAVRARRRRKTAVPTEGDNAKDIEEEAVAHINSLNDKADALDNQTKMDADAIRKIVKEEIAKANKPRPVVVNNLDKLLGWTFWSLILGLVTIAVLVWANAPKPVTDANDTASTAQRYPGGWVFDPVTHQWHREDQ